MLKTKALCLVGADDTKDTIHGKDGQDMTDVKNIQDRKVVKDNNDGSVKQKDKDSTGITGLIGKKQNIVIESYGEAEAVKGCITRLAMLLVKKDSLMKKFIRKLRNQYCENQKAFSFSLAAWSKEEKKEIREIFAEELCGVVECVDGDDSTDIISGNLVFSTEARSFLTGTYMEIGVYEIIKEAMEELAAKHGVPYKLYRNVKVTTKTGFPKNEFDIVIECQGIFYVVEVKSGGQFDAWGNLLEVGKEYDIVPHRLLLVDSYLSEEKAGRIEEFCKYYVSNLEQDTLKQKVLLMVGNDL